MECKSCQEVVSPKFKHAIKNNQCPFCGDEIMDPVLGAILKNLQELMKEAEPFMDQVKDWLSSNYSLGTVKQLTNDVVRNHSSSGDILMDDNFDDNLLQKQIAMSKQKVGGSFAERAGIKPSSQQDPLKIKSLVSKIQNGGGAAAPEDFVGEDPDYGFVDMSDEKVIPLTQNDAAQMADIFAESMGDLDQISELEKIKRLQGGPRGNGKTVRRAGE